MNRPNTSDVFQHKTAKPLYLVQGQGSILQHIVVCVCVLCCTLSVVQSEIHVECQIWTQFSFCPHLVKIMMYCVVMSCVYKESVQVSLVIFGLFLSWHNSHCRTEAMQ